MRLRNFIRGETGAGTVEFVAILPAFLAIFFMVLEVGAAWFWWETAEKAAQLGARIAIVRDPAVEGMPVRNPLRAGAVYGLPCGGDANPCDYDAQETWKCTGDGSGCNAASVQDIISEMERLTGTIDQENVVVTYRYVELGYAGGPLIPAVTVTLTGLPFGLFLGFLAAMAGADGYATLPDISATLTGEDLSAAGVGI